MVLAAFSLGGLKNADKENGGRCAWKNKKLKLPKEDRLIKAVLVEQCALPGESP